MFRDDAKIKEDVKTLLHLSEMFGVQLVRYTIWLLERPERKEMCYSADTPPKKKRADL
jgi:hypothetical protein